jgi:putative transposase
VLPDHLHSVLTLPAGDTDFSNHQGHQDPVCKSHTAKRARSAVRAAKGELEICQRRFWEHAVRHDKDYARHMDYRYYNPMKHGHVKYAIYWWHSTIHRYIAASIIFSDWAGGHSSDGLNFGEPG